MKNILVSILALPSLLIAGGTPGQTKASSPIPVFEVSGEVKLVQAANKVSQKDASNIAVWLVPQGATRPATFVQPQEKYRMVQRNKMFEPSLLVVPIGSSVDFPNLDPWFHNVFSLYRGKRFDLGLYEAGAHKEIKFDRPGASYIFCNIHPEMAAVVLAIESDFYGVSDKSGRFSIAHVPAGKYLLRFWYEDTDPGNLDSLARPIVIERNENFPPISIPVTKQSAAKHKNKYGRDYDPAAGATVY